MKGAGPGTAGAPPAPRLARAELGASAGLPAFVIRELRRYLSCGVLAARFARSHCPACGRDMLVVAFRSVPVEWGPRLLPLLRRLPRRPETAAHRVDRGLPDVPVRRWVLSFPHCIRDLLAFDPTPCAAVRHIIVRAVLVAYRA